MVFTQLRVDKGRDEFWQRLPPSQIWCDRGGGKVGRWPRYGVCADTAYVPLVDKQMGDEVGGVPCAIVTQLQVDKWPRQILAAVATFLNMA